MHQLYLSGHISRGNPNLELSVTALARRFSMLGLDSHRALAQSYARVYRALVGQATTLAYLDTFFLLAVAACVMFAATFFLRKNDPHSNEA